MIGSEGFVALVLVFFFNDTATTEIYTLSLPDALPICNDVPGTFLFGAFFAMGWTACLGPILAGILGIGALLHNIWYSALLLFFYSLGNLVPLFILSVFYDKLDLSSNRLIRGRMFRFSVFGKELRVHSTNLAAGILFMVLGVILIAYKGTYVFNNMDIFGTKPYFYSIQRSLISWEHANALGVAAFILFVVVIGGFLWSYKSGDDGSG